MTLRSNNYFLRSRTSGLYKDSASGKAVRSLVSDRVPQQYGMKRASLIKALSTSALLLMSSWAHALEPSKIVYQLELDSERFGKATLGRIETQLSEDDGHFSVATQTKAEGMAAILVGNLTESCDFDIVDGLANSQYYSGGRPDKVEYFVDFNWTDRKVIFNSLETLDMPQGYLVDNCNMPFAMALLKDQEIKETIYIVDGNKTRIRGYQFQSKSREMLSTKLGSLDTVKIVLARELKPEKTLTLWLSKKHDFLPVQMQERREGRTTTMYISDFSTQD
jgi:hypothetical protein